jgi:hypothetical protein
MVWALGAMVNLKADTCPKDNHTPETDQQATHAPSKLCT